MIRRRVRQAEDLIAAAVGQDRAVPADEAVQAAGAGDQLVARPADKMIGIAEDDLGTELLEVAVRQPLTAPRVPTGMKAGVWTTPCGVACRAARRVAPVRTKADGSNTVRRASVVCAGGRASLRRAPPAFFSLVKRLRIGVLYGGRSGGHEVSLASAAAVFASLDR